MEGKSHITKEEFENYEEESKEMIDSMLTDDSDREDWEVFIYLIIKTDSVLGNINIVNKL